MEIYQLRTFVAVAQAGSLARASGMLHTSQPAISTHIRSLEEELGVALFHRTSKGMELTREGERLLRNAVRTLEAVDGMLHQAKSLQRDLTGSLRLGLNTDPKFLRVMELMSAVLEKHPGIEFHLLQGQSVRMQDDLLSGKVDAGFMYGSCGHDHIQSIQVHEVPLVVVGPAAWREKLEKADWCDLEKMPWIMTTPDCPFHMKMYELFRRHGLTPCKAAMTDDEAVLHSMVRSGGGLTIMREDAALAGAAEQELMVWPGEPLFVALSFVTLRKRANDPLLRALRQGLGRVWALEDAGEPLAMHDASLKSEEPQAG